MYDITQTNKSFAPLYNSTSPTFSFTSVPTTLKTTANRHSKCVHHTKHSSQHNARTREHKGTCLTKCQLGRANHSFCPTIVVLWFCSINTRKLVIVTFFQPNVSCVPNITAIGKFRFIYSLEHLQLRALICSR